MRVRYLDDWVEALGAESENEFVATLEGLQVLPSHFWKRPQFGMLSGRSYRGIGEIIFRGDNKQYRVFGYFGPQPGYFTMLHACVKQRRQVKDDMDLAAKRKKILDQRRGSVYEFAIKRRPDRKTTQ
jgi:hypothetical protein